MKVMVAPNFLQQTCNLGEMLPVFRKQTVIDTKIYCHVCTV